MSTVASELLLRNAVVDGRGPLDLRLADGLIAAMEPAGRLTGDGLDLGGVLLLPGLIDAHIHLDKTFLGLAWIPHRSDGTVRGRIATEKAIRRELAQPIRVRARRMIAHLAVRGTTRVRSHVDIDTEIGLAHVEALVALRAEVRDLVDVQLVAFPQSGVVSHPGAAELMDEALHLGCDVVGGLDPAGIDGAIDAQLDVVFGLAEKHGKLVDIHLHDAGELGCFELEQIAARTVALGRQGDVVVSHAFGLGGVAETRARRCADTLAAAGVAIMTNGPAAAPMPPVALLAEHGVTVFVGSDNVRDAWSPYGNADILDRARLVGYRAHLVTDDALRHAFDLVTRHPAKVMGAPPPAIEVGAPADLVAVRAEVLPEAVAAAPRREVVVKAGRLVAQAGELVGG